MSITFYFSVPRYADDVCQTSPDDDARDDTDLEDVDTNQNTDFEC